MKRTTCDAGGEETTQTTFDDPEPARPEPETRTEAPRDDEFVDGRESGPDAGEQRQLVADADDGQVTLGGEDADGRSLWGE